MAVAGVQAQSGAKIEVNVPFDFIAGKRSFEAGTYSLSRMSDGNLLIRSADGKGNTIVQAPVGIVGRDYISNERLVFIRYGNQYFLSEVWLKGGIGRQLLPFDTEKKVARKQQLALVREVRSSN